VLRLDGGEQPGQPALQRFDQIVVDPGQQAIPDLDDLHPAAEGGIERAQFETDVTAADDQERCRDVGQGQGPG